MFASPSLASRVVKTDKLSNRLEVKFEASTSTTDNVERSIYCSPKCPSSTIVICTIISPQSPPPPQAPNTPIASIKRPRQKPSTTSDTTPPTTNTSSTHPPLGSPMHSATAVRRLDSDDTKENETTSLAQK